MAIRADSYSSTGEVRAMVRHLLDGNSTFNSTTRPTLVEVEKFIDRASATLNLSLSGAGFATPVSNTTAKLVCDDWVTAQAGQWVELTQRGSGYSDAEGSRTQGFANLAKNAGRFIDQNYRGFLNLGVTVSHQSSDGLQFTGLDARGQRDDPSDSTLAQPKFTRSLFDEPQQANYTDEVDDD